MLSSANLDFTGMLIDLAFMLFFGVGVGYSLIVGIIHIIQKKTKTFGYYLRTFLIAGIVGLALGAFGAFIITLSLMA
ncbi:hypothetical protein [Sphingobacterium sp. BIGb0165]|uniref:hypothetical protein n=1 Tax=Sphingobacterium sp. BIGb0165 TaxID=2940615 RepID=UPI00216918F1|nr:hypothetical protein [Sphingobacterium sp. BIGb0165]MCS4225533.1 hypothetical protein [Sphingobacterium sp. BIGb0165]